MIVSRGPEGAQVAPVTPIVAPSWDELWGRNQLALSVIGHRTYGPETAELLTRILTGEPIEHLMRTPGGAA